MRGVLVLMLTGAAWCQSVRRPPELEALVGLARTAPPAVQSYALLMVAGRAPQDWRAELADEAFTLAGYAPDPYPMRLIPGVKQSGPVTLRAGRRSTGLDRLSLQMAAISLLAFTTKGTALERLPRLRIQPATCSDAFVPDVSAFYRQLTFLVHPLSRRRMDLKAYESLLASIESPVEVVPAAQMLAAMAANPVDSARMLERFTTALESINGDDRSFSSSLPLLPGEVQRMTDALEKRGVDTTAFRRAVREYVTRHFRSRRCADTAANTPLTLRVAKAFELDPEELRPMEAEGLPDLGVDEEPAQLVELRNAWNRMQFEGQLRREKSDANFEAFLSRLDGWTEDEEFKLEFVGSLASSVTGSWRSAFLKRYLELLNRIPVEEQADLFLAAQPLANFLRSMEDGERHELLSSLENSRNPALVLFVQLERVLRRSPR